MVGPQDGGFGFDQSKKYTNVDNLDEVCAQCQAGQHKKCLKKAGEQKVCDSPNYFVDVLSFSNFCLVFSCSSLSFSKSN